MHEGLGLSILGLFGLLTIAVLMLPVTRRIGIPYTVFLAAIGIALGFALKPVHGLDLGIVGDFLNGAESFGLTSEIVFFVFLPALVFESALAIDIRRLLADIWPILLLAILGLLISSFLVGGAVWAVAGVPFVVCLLLGAILSATDPVAVVAIFKDLGAPKRLAVLVEGESLFNDATAIVLFNIVAAIILTGAGASVMNGVQSFLTIFVGGILVGLIMSWVYVKVIARVQNMAVVEVTLTISLAYLSFLVAEHYLHVSGVMATVTSALVIGSKGRTAISSDGWHLLKETWETLGFWANSLIFVLVGLAVPVIMSNISSDYWLVLSVALVSAFLARAVLTHGMVPAMAFLHISMPVSGGFRTVMWWGGLRGAVSLALALSVYENPAFSLQVREFVVTVVCGFVLFTLFINAPTVGLVMRFFRLDQLSASDLVVRDRAIKSAIDTIAIDLPMLADRQRIAPESAQMVVADYESRASERGALTAGNEDLREEDWLKIGLQSVIGQERQGYLDQYAAGHIASQIAQILLGNADDIRDQTKVGGLAGWTKASNAALSFGWQFRAALTLQRRFQINRPLSQSLAKRFETLRTMRLIVLEVRDHGLADLESIVPANVLAKLSLLQDQRERDISQALAAIREQYPQYARDLDQRYLERCAIRQERESYDRLNDEAIIGGELHLSLLEGLDARYKALSSQPKLDLGLSPMDLISKVPLFMTLPHDRQQAIAKILRPRLSVPGETIIRKGDSGTGMYFVSSGAVRVDIDPAPVVVGTGAFFGEMSLVNRLPRTADVVSLGYCDLLALTRRDFDTLMAMNDGVRQEVESVARQRQDELSAKG
ncbi:MAG: cation:proton antiporter [Sphingorhabdus sp.]|jgi:monovalent cation:H+ antiporter, CPA1 family|uniref:cation:proton antiporter n=1 Tax=Sphingorhabdus sp. TaxID=1902408 RepID=UPI00273EC9DE|nr:cation:proton antiporter [Sphingorhabdus sp.]MDP4872745.1 cation:proton antiporter [Sphingorhabdus sp.]